LRISLLVQKNACVRTVGLAVNAPYGSRAGRHMAVGQLKVSVWRGYGVGLESGARSSPDSSGSPQQRAELPFVQRFD
jgi:hypothetical protein